MQPNCLYKNRFLAESVRVISNILDVTKSLNIDGYMLTIDIEKAFDSMDFCFLLEALKKLRHQHTQSAGI